MVKVKIIPINKTIKVKSGKNLGSLLQEYGLELPCGGYGTCGKCRVKISEGKSEITPADQKYIAENRLKKGWRLACQHQIKGDITVEVEQWEIDTTTIKKETSHLEAEHYGIAIDAGTTTIAGRLIDLDSGNILRTEVAYNRQKKYGADIMTRISYGLENKTGNLRKALFDSLKIIIDRLTANLNDNIVKINIVGNTFIHHVFGGFELKPLVTIPYKASSLDEINLDTRALKWEVSGNPIVTFLPNLGGYVGSDILAGILSTTIHQKAELSLLLDIGTNGEIVLGNREKLYFTSTAAGPAFEGGKIRMGMRADRGAILHTSCQDNKIIAQVKDDVAPKGICGSGLLDAIACGLMLGKIDYSGRIMSDKTYLSVKKPVKIYQQDIRELQLAKGAIAAGIEILLRKAEISLEDLDRFYLAGAFGNYMKVESANRIGLIKMDKERVESNGNTALKGAVLSLLGENYHQILNITEKINLKTVKDFQRLYVDNMNFPKK